MTRILISAVSLFVCLVASLPSAALDNPDSPDLIGDFQARSAVYEAEISTQAGNAGRSASATAKYRRFLDAELNKAYGGLVKKLDPQGRNTIVKSQRRWLAYRDDEFRFIDENWTPAKFGDSSILSVGTYKAEIVRDRTMTILSYLKNYP